MVIIMIRKYSSSLLIVLMTCIFIFHFAITLFYNFPLNPISNQYNLQIQNYMNPLFTQNWKLFAPNPVSANNMLYIRGNYTDEYGEIKQTNWIDATTPFNMAVHNNRFTPVRLVNSTRSSITTELLNQMDGKKDYLEKIEPNKSVELIILNRFSSRVLNEIYPNYKFVDIEKKIVVNVFPEYGKGKETEKNYEYNLPKQVFDLPKI